MSGSIRSLELDPEPPRDAVAVELVSGQRVDAESNDTPLEFRAESHAGPLPHPKTLSEYDQWLPGAGKAIAGNWQKESDDRRQPLRLAAIRIPTIGQAMGFVAVMGALAISGFAILLGQSMAGFGVVFVALLPWREYGSREEDDVEGPVGPRQRATAPSCSIESECAQDAASWPN